MTSESRTPFDPARIRAVAFDGYGTLFDYGIPHFRVDVAAELAHQGVELEDGITAPAKVATLAPHLLGITIHEGRNRQIRRMCDAVGHPVTRLVRHRIGPVSDTRLPPGAWRSLTPVEVRDLALATAPGEDDR